MEHAVGRTMSGVSLVDRCSPRGTRRSARMRSKPSRGGDETARYGEAWFKRPASRVTLWASQPGDLSDPSLLVAATSGAVSRRHECYPPLNQAYGESSQTVEPVRSGHFREERP